VPGSGDLINFSLRDCEIYAAGANIVTYESAHLSSISYTNTLFHEGQIIVATRGSANFYNNLFVGSTNDEAQFQQLASGALIAKDNAFDTGLAYLEGNHSTNAFLNTTGVRSSIQTGDIVTNLSWLDGPLGRYYQPTNSPLINSGSQTADRIGLYHYTATIDQAKETKSIVDIGYHYVALDNNGTPIDSDGEGIPDYLEDANGDGSVTPGETDWQSISIEGLGVLITYPQNNSLIP
jgi:hypothetical protein